MLIQSLYCLWQQIKNQSINQSLSLSLSWTGANFGCTRSSVRSERWESRRIVRRSSDTQRCSVIQRTCGSCGGVCLWRVGGEGAIGDKDVGAGLPRPAPPWPSSRGSTVFPAGAHVTNRIQGYCHKKVYESDWTRLLHSSFYGTLHFFRSMGYAKKTDCSLTTQRWTYKSVTLQFLLK